MAIKKIEGEELTLFIDYDKGKLAKLSYHGKVQYFEARVKKILINPLKILTRKEILIKLESDDEESVGWFCIVNLICDGIDALGSFYRGHEATRGSFLSFIEKYMDKNFRNKKLRNKTYGEHVKDYFRDSLSHGLCIKRGGIEHFEKYFNEDENGNLQINPRYFLKDFLGAFEKYVDDLKKNSSKIELGNNFLNRFNSIFIRGE